MMQRPRIIVHQDEVHDGALRTQREVKALWSGRGVGYWCDALGKNYPVPCRLEQSLHFIECHSVIA